MQSQFPRTGSQSPHKALLSVLLSSSIADDTPNFGDYSEPRLLAELAREAETAGWDGFFLGDHIGASWPFPIGDPLISLAAMAMATERIKLGTLVTPLPRRRPWKLARETVTLDHLSNGRLILGVGIGSDIEKEYSCFGEAGDDRLHGAMLDKRLDVLVGLWSGEPFSYSGEYYNIKQACFQPPPVQSPRIPIWVTDVWPHKRPLHRAAAWDGVVPLADDRVLTPDEIQSIVAYVKERRISAEPFDVVFGSPDLDKNLTAEYLPAYAQAGVTWWLECSSWNHSLAEVRERILYWLLGSSVRIFAIPASPSPPLHLLGALNSEREKQGCPSRSS